MSPEFLSLSLTAILMLSIFKGLMRHIVFLAANAVFLLFLLLGVNGTISTVLFCLVGYIFTRFILWRPRWVFVPCLVIYIFLFIYMRNYDFLGFLLSDRFLVEFLRTVGLSFLFFKVLHVMIEARSGTLGRLEFLTYLNYCLNFTTFMMGPIQRYQDYYEQWHGIRLAIPLEFEAHLDAVLRILVGLLKVYVLAIWVESWALRPDTDLINLSLLGWLKKTYAFYFFLYFNFSGYCDVVIGVGSLMGVRPPENFDKPFLARNVSDFWLRQHRSLTLWLTDYVFSPLYKMSLGTKWLSSHPLFSANIVLILTMIVSGLWHGTSLSFLLFGISHGVFLIIYHTWDTILKKWLGRKSLRELRLRSSFQAAGIFITFNATAFAFVFFRVETSQIMRYLSSLVG
jgi:D-alanyl-lipoteichoic acid acyltransferase DltB (MBOAT superfamily)